MVTALKGLAFGQEGIEMAAPASRLLYESRFTDVAPSAPEQVFILGVQKVLTTITGLNTRI